MTQWMRLAVALAFGARTAAGAEEQEHYAAAVPAGLNQLPLVVASNETQTAGCHSACEALASRAGDGLTTHYGALPDTFASSFYAVQQRELLPVCVVEPETAEAVSIVVKAVTEFSCPFAIKSGGHSNAPGTNNRHGGLVIDLKKLDQVEVSADNSTVAVGPGNPWSRVYDHLMPLGLAVVGGRVNSVGVGGYTLGGGISFLSRRYGFAVDNVRNFEVVLPDGTIVNANPDSYPDIYFALRGGGSSFGIVTRFDLQAYPHGKFWGGSNANFIRGLPGIKSGLDIEETWGWSLTALILNIAARLQHLIEFFGFGVHRENVIDAFATLANDEQTDRGAHAYIFLSFTPSVRTYMIGSTCLYSDATEDPEVLRPLTKYPSIMSTGRLHGLTDFTREVTDMNPLDSRQNWHTATFKFDAELIKDLWDIFIQESAPLRYQIPSALMATNLQLITKDEIRMSRRNGGNAFGIKEEDAPVFFFSVTCAYADATEDEAIRAMTRRVYARGEALAKSRGLWHPFLYPNYAAVEQDVHAGFAPETLARLLAIQKQYDPSRRFANLQPEHLTLNDKKLKSWADTDLGDLVREYI